MSNIRVTQKQIDDLLNNAEFTTETKFGKATVVTVKLASGFVLTESSACVDPENYNEDYGKRICIERIVNKLWELEGYCLQKEEYEKHHHYFGWALQKLNSGHKLRRRGWNGKGIHIEMQKPDAYSKMTQPYLYIETSNLQSDNPDAPRGRVPWFPSQTDMLAEDWELAED